MTRAALACGLAVLAASAALAAPESVTILRDAYGVPHLFLGGPGAARRSAYANGYAQAEDRLFQMDLLRRAATGRLAERVGPDFLLMDQVVRRDAPTVEERARMFRRLRVRERQALEAYRDGVNAFIAQPFTERDLQPPVTMETIPVAPAGGR